MKLQIAFGAISPTIRKQIADQGAGISVTDAEFIQRMADAVTLLSVQGILPDFQVQKARAKLMKRITSSTRPAAEPLDQAMISRILGSTHEPLRGNGLQQLQQHKAKLAAKPKPKPKKRKPAKRKDGA